MEVVATRRPVRRLSAAASHQAVSSNSDPIEYDETGSGPTVLFVPGSLSTGAAWKQIVAALARSFRCVTTSLLGNGRTAERRMAAQPSIEPQLDALEQLIARTGCEPVHIVAHSYGGVATLALALRRSVPIASLVLVEPNPADVLRQAGELELYGAFRAMSDAYVEAFAHGEARAVARVVDFYGGAGAFAALPERLREHLVANSASNILDWSSMYGFRAAPAEYGSIAIPMLIVRGMRGHRGMLRIAEILQLSIDHSTLVSIEDAGHFMLVSHATRLAQLIAAHVTRAEASSVRAVLSSAHQPEAP